MKNKSISRIVLAALLGVSLLLPASCSSRKATILPNEFTRTEAVVPNPMKGFAAIYEKADQDASLEYIGLKFNEIYSYENGEGKLNSVELDYRLLNVAERGHSAILRVYMLNPGYVDSVQTGLFLPDELYEELKSAGDIYSTHTSAGVLEYPDFNSEKLISVMTDFIEQLGRRYDGNPSIATIQMGLYGSWGEWNMSGCGEGNCQMTNKNLQRIIESYVSSFKKTKLMGRNPSLGYANEFPIGYHDDNFLFNTSDFHKKNSEWKKLLRKQNYSYGTLQQFYDFINGNGGKYKPLWDVWKTQMFGGELSLQMYQEPFGPLWSGTEREALEYCINQFHMSWLMGVGVGGIPELNSDEYKEFRKVAGSFGYDLYIDSVTGKDRMFKMTTAFGNSGIAPFYYDWVLEYRIIDAQGGVVYTYRDSEFRLSELLPGDTAESVFFIPEELKAGEYIVRARFVNPAEEVSKTVMPLRLSNNNEIRDGFYELAHLIVE